LTSGIGISFSLFWVLTMVLFRHSSVPIRARDTLILSVASIAVMGNGLLIWWFAPLALFVIVPHAADLLGQKSSSPANHPSQTNDVRSRESAPSSLEQSPARPFQFIFTLACGLMVWLSFALSPVSTPVLGGTPRPMEKLHNRQTPFAVSQYLRQTPPDKLVWAPLHWGDWLVWDGPAGLQVFANSAASILPRQVRFDYTQIAGGEGTWAGLLDQYDVGVLVIDKQRQGRLMRSALQNGQKWRIALEDEHALVLARTPEATPWPTTPEQSQLALSEQNPPTDIDSP
jgi:hypothetical protein